MCNELISVIVPIYNAEAYLDRCVSSIMGQTYENLEIILVDDDSPDNCPKLCDEYANKDKRIRVIHKSNDGVAAARNCGIKAANGYALYFADADDWLDAAAIEKAVNAMLVNDCQLVMEDYTMEYGNHSEPHHYCDSVKVYHGSGRYEFVRASLIPQSGVGFIWGKLFRREWLIDKALLLNEDLVAAEDAEFMFRCCSCAERMMYINVNGYHYFFNTSSAVRKLKNDYADRYLNAMEEVKRYIDADSALSIYKETFYSFVLYHLLLCVVNYSFHPERAESVGQQIGSFKKLCRVPLFAVALKHVHLGDFSLSRRVTLILIKLKQYWAVRLVALYRHRQFKSMSGKD